MTPVSLLTLGCGRASLGIPLIVTTFRGSAHVRVVSIIVGCIEGVFRARIVSVFFLATRSDLTFLFVHSSRPAVLSG